MILGVILALPSYLNYDHYIVFTNIDSFEISHFEHPPLLTSSDGSRRDGTRLLRLLPGPKDTTIQLQMYSVPLPCVETYVAISYEWATPGNGKIVIVNNNPFYVRENLWKFLCQLRSQLEHKLPLTLWADAICIDQWNIQERNHQVKLMYLIFSGAVATYSWLGDEGKDTRRLFTILNSWLCSEKIRTREDYLQPRKRLKEVAQIRARSTAAFEAFQDLHDRSYWL